MSVIGLVLCIMYLLYWFLVSVIFLVQICASVLIMCWLIMYWRTQCVTLSSHARVPAAHRSHLSCSFASLPLWVVCFLLWVDCWGLDHPCVLQSPSIWPEINEQMFAEHRAMTSLQIEYLGICQFVVLFWCVCVCARACSLTHMCCFCFFGGWGCIYYSYQLF